MSDQQLETQTAKSQDQSSSYSGSLNRARIIEFSDLESTPPTNKHFPEVKTKTHMKILSQQEEIEEEEWRDLLTKSLIVQEETPGVKKSTLRQEKTADVRVKHSGKFQRCCPICLGQFDKIRGSLECLHEFCFSCISQWTESSTICPCCRKPFTSILKMVREETTGPVKDTIRISVEKKELVYESEYDHYLCYMCGSGEDEHVLLICDDCDFYCCHVYCDPDLKGRLPMGDWFCIYCRERRMRRRRPGFISLGQLDVGNSRSRMSELVGSSTQTEKGVSSRTRSRELGQSQNRNSLNLLRNLRRRVR